MPHPNSIVLEKLYRDFAKGDLAAVLGACADQATFQVAGRSPLAGKYTKAEFGSLFVPRLMELSAGTASIEVHDIMANDRHGVVLATERLTRKGEAKEFRTVHVWRFEGGKAIAWYEYPRDLYQYDSIFS